ncbi:hypothetical protein FBY51_0133 [Zymomonas mobilis]|uniref:hypothetical protein n=1 Tax=Zymomonas mobilis TaxID=542 RepID=UPI00026D8013|nr:hypothetical protein [Zymomonas mobilis]AFN56375.1 hypothetical protein ZZ6_0476 [Zymomonas mobilis subsp. mobilis ATCC 29191]TQK78194.1 hypothetical protein FBY53_0854 [Zymomonas mobilis]TQL15159.1 hypothetical protein FBY51_0133 [Zymomonas mobilis]
MRNLMSLFVAAGILAMAPASYAQAAAPKLAKMKCQCHCKRGCCHHHSNHRMHHHDEPSPNTPKTES